MTPPKPKSKPQKAAQAAEKLATPEDRTAALARAAVLKEHDFNRAKQLTPSAPALAAEGRSSSPQTPDLPISAASSAPETPRPTPVPDQPSSTDSQLVAIDKPVYGGDFLARVDGKALFVPLTLPGEQALVRITHHKRGYATAEPGQILHPAPERIAPACPHFGVCGGCHYQHAGYAPQLALKQSILRETLDRASVPIPAAIEILSANPWHYRNRIRLALDSAGNPGYRGRRSHAVIPIRECPIAAPLLLQAAQSFAAIARSDSTLVPPLRAGPLL